MQFKQHPAIKYFVKHSLGCTCPDTVFDEVDVEEKNQLAGKRINYVRILVGSRLLIYVLKDIRVSTLQSVIPLAIHAGKEERDAMKYNRFRLVLDQEHDVDLVKTAHSVFENIPEKDERIHIHIITGYNTDKFLSIDE